MHRHDRSTEVLTQAVIRYAIERTRLDPPPLDGPRTAAELHAMVGTTISSRGMGGLEALRVFADVLAPACISVDHPRFWSFVPTAPTEAAILFDLVVGASAIYGGSWMEGAGAVFAENQALRWIADLAGFPPGAGGVFVPGGTYGNLSALTAARERWRGRTGDDRRAVIVCSSGAHSSLKSAAKVMDAEVVMVAADVAGRMTGAALRAAIADAPAAITERVCAIVATSGTTNAGVIDDLTAAADVAAELNAWFHVDGAYGAAALAAPSVRSQFIGVERADSLIVDPHKWLFAPYDCCALIYRDPLEARAALSQHAEYLDVLQADENEWNPSDFAFGLTRRARGLPFWFSLAAHGTAAYTDAIEASLTLTRETTALIATIPELEVVGEPELSVVMFRRLGWQPADYYAWSARLLADGTAFVTPTSWNGETILRLCFVNPRSTLDDVRETLATLG